MRKPGVAEHLGFRGAQGVSFFGAKLLRKRVEVFMRPLVKGIKGYGIQSFGCVFLQLP